VFHTRIELRQIGVRDEAKMLGGLGPCGRPICCGSFLGDFQPVSIKMAKEQNLSLNPTKISGVCGRLMCCLKFEQDHYEATRKRMPKVGKEVDTPEGFGSVFDINVLKATVTVRIHKGEAFELKTFPLEEIKWNKPAQPQPAVEKREESKGEAKRAKKVKAPKSLSSEPLTEVDEAENVEEIKPVDQSNDWLRAVEEALNAAQNKQ
jgi:cell fate regulator YaaT (PSP1 superfamily)